MQYNFIYIVENGKVLKIGLSHSISLNLEKNGQKLQDYFKTNEQNIWLKIDTKRLSFA